MGILPCKCGSLHFMYESKLPMRSQATFSLLYAMYRSNLAATSIPKTHKCHTWYNDWQKWSSGSTFPVSWQVKSAVTEQHKPINVCRDDIRRMPCERNALSHYTCTNIYEQHQGHARHDQVSLWQQRPSRCVTSPGIKAQRGDASRTAMWHSGKHEGQGQEVYQKFFSSFCLKKELYNTHVRNSGEVICPAGFYTDTRYFESNSKVLNHL